MDWPTIIRGITGMSQQEYAELEFAVGIAFLEMMEGDDQRLLNHLKKSTEYWEWWRKQFWMLGREFINRNRIEKLTTLSKEVVRYRFTDYCTIVKVSDHGVESYSYIAVKAQRQMVGQTAED